MNHKLLYNTLWATILMSIVLMSYVSYLLYWPVQTLVVKNSPMPIIGEKTVKQGETITYRYDYCKYYDHPLSIQRDFVDGIIYKTDESRAQLQPGCHVQDVTIPIPETLPPGNYKVRNITQIVINQLRIATVTYETQVFTVKSSDLESIK